MEYAINKIIDKLVSAKMASKFNLYSCPVCQKPVSYRSGPQKKPYFAHMPGVGTKECENFTPSQNITHPLNDSSSIVTKWKMELYLHLPKKSHYAGWSLELLLPKHRACHASMKLDLGGGRSQTVDMRGMDKDRRMMVELSTASYRITEFIGKPDPYFKSNFERECVGLPTSKAAVFSISKENSQNSFPRAQILKSFTTVALLWQEAQDISFPEELIIEYLPKRQGWSLALVTIPDELTLDCINWLSKFTGLPFEESKSSINLIWPFLTKKSSVNTIECIKSDSTLFAITKISKKQQEIIFQSDSKRLSALYVDRPTAFFEFKPEDSKNLSIENKNSDELNEQISFYIPLNKFQYPLVELAFKFNNGDYKIVSLHQRCCLETVLEARKQQVKLEYISMPIGAKGKIFIDESDRKIKIDVYSSERVAPHNQRMRIPSLEIIDELSMALINPESQVTIDFDGFGMLHLAGKIWGEEITSFSNLKLSSSLRSRLFSFLLQLNYKSPLPVNCDDKTLINLLTMANPKSTLIPHYRLLMKEVFQNELNNSGFKRGGLK